MIIQDRIRSAIPRIVDALALVAMALRAPTVPLARMARCDYPINKRSTFSTLKGEHHE